LSHTSGYLAFQVFIWSQWSLKLLRLFKEEMRGTPEQFIERDDVWVQKVATKEFEGRSLRVCVKPIRVPD